MHSKKNKGKRLYLCFEHPQAKICCQITRNYNIYTQLVSPPQQTKTSSGKHGIPHMRKIKSYIFEYRYEMIFLYLCSFLYILPRIISGVDYNDDIFRSETGDATWWYYNGRPLVVWSMQALNQNFLISDLTPLPVILGMTILVACCIFLIKRFLSDCTVATKFTICAAFVINPFFISNISYKYDAFPMYIALGLSVISALMEGRKPSLSIEIPRSVLLIFILCLYQAALSLIFSLIALDLCVTALKGRVDIRQQIYRAVTVVFSYFFYSKIIAPHYLRFLYVDMSQHVSLNHEGMALLGSNIKTSFSLLSSFYHGGIMHACMIVYALIYIAGFIFILRKPRTQNQTNIFIILAAYLSGLCVIMLCTLSLTVLLKNPYIEPRVLLGSFGFIISAPVILLSISRAQIMQYCAVILCVMQILPTLALSFSFGNYLKQEFTHDTDAAKELEFHLSHYATNAQTTLTFLNDNPTTPSMDVKTAIHPLIRSFMNSQGLGRTYGWYSKGFLNAQDINYELDNSYQPAGKFVPMLKTCHVATSFVDNRVLVTFQLQC